MTQEAPPSFNKLVSTIPAIAGLADDARSIAVHARWDWYPRWIGESIIFRIACHRAAQRLDVDERDISPVALEGLLAVYRAEQRRLRASA